MSIALENEHEQHDREAKERIRHNVKVHGCHIALLDSQGYGPPFAFTIGLFENFGHPEIIAFGLKTEFLAAILNGVKDEVRSGSTFNSQKLYDGFLEGYEVQFLPVAPDNYRDYLGYAGWYYGDTWDFPVLQLLWPDKNHLWPWDEGFFEDWKYIQPLLDRNADFKFYESRNRAAFTTSQALEGKTITYVSHGKDGSWQFHCEEHPDLKDAKVVCLEHLIHMDPTLNEIFYINYGEYAERSDRGAAWVIGRLQDEEEPLEETEIESSNSTVEPAPSKEGLWKKIKKLWS